MDALPRVRNEETASHRGESSSGVASGASRAWQRSAGTSVGRPSPAPRGQHARRDAPRQGTARLSATPEAH